MKKNRIIMTATMIAAAMLPACEESDRSDNYNYLGMGNVSESDGQYSSDEFEDVFAENSLSSISENSTAAENKDERSKSTVPDVTIKPTTEITTEFLPENSEETEKAAVTEYVVTESVNINVEEYLETGSKCITLIEAPYISQDS